MRLKPLVPLLAVLLVACQSPSSRKVKVYQNESFSSEETFSRMFDASVQATCEAARRALLSQGYVMNVVRPDYLTGTKSFQPDGEVHVQITFNVACVTEGDASKVSTAFVSAIQDRYALKKSPTSASVGVSAIGSLSIPLSSTEDAMVKVGSETIPSVPFYDRFFALMQRYVQQDRAPG